jgi:predicted  nucleic acid-binding Zn-ribbon protein
MTSQKSGLNKDDLKSFKEEIIHQFHVVSEGVIDQVKLVAEGVAIVNEKLERTRKELKEEIDNKTQPIAQAVLELSGKVVALDGKVVALEGNVVALDGKVVALDGKVVALDAKVVDLDGKVDRFHQELKTEIQDTRQEVLAAVKFSYAELDKRLTTLEKEFVELKHRVEKIESRPVS